MSSQWRSNLFESRTTSLFSILLRSPDSIIAPWAKGTQRERQPETFSRNEPLNSQRSILEHVGEKRVIMNKRDYKSLTCDKNKHVVEFRRKTKTSLLLESYQHRFIDRVVLYFLSSCYFLETLLLLAFWLLWSCQFCTICREKSTIIGSPLKATKLTYRREQWSTQIYACSNLPQQVSSIFPLFASQMLLVFFSLLKKPYSVYGTCQTVLLLSLLHFFIFACCAAKKKSQRPWPHKCLGHFA